MFFEFLFAIPLSLNLSMESSLLVCLKVSLFLTLFITPSQSENLETKKTDNEFIFYTGTFDTIDKEGDDKSSLIGMEHKSENLFRDTFIGKFAPITGGFISGKNSIYFCELC